LPLFSFYTNFAKAGGEDHSGADTGCRGGLQQIRHVTIGNRQDDTVRRLRDGSEVRIARTIHHLAILRIDGEDSTWVAEIP
jgi:hypothetical protein